MTRHVAAHILFGAIHGVFVGGAVGVGLWVLTLVSFFHVVLAIIGGGLVGAARGWVGAKRVTARLQRLCSVRATEPSFLVSDQGVYGYGEYGKLVDVIVPASSHGQGPPDGDAFEEKLKELLEEHEGKYALFYGGSVVGIYNTRDAAFAQGLRRYRAHNAFFVNEVRKRYLLDDTKPFPER